MIVTLVHVWVKENFVEEFIKVSIENHIQSVKESGNLRFDILQDADNPTKFVLYEAYESEATVAAHKETAHYLKWRNTVADWMMQPRQGIRHKIIYPIDTTSW